MRVMTGDEPRVNGVFKSASAAKSEPIPCSYLKKLMTESFSFLMCLVDK
jgi:hypothetical protein